MIERERRHLVLVGLPGSGKSTVGAMVAELLDTHLTDVDRVIERATGLSVAELFLEEGEDAFRARERQAVLDALLLPAHVISPGGGWAAAPGNLASAGDRAFTVYLEVAPEVAAARLGDARNRPLLQTETPLRDRLRDLLVRREKRYQEAAVRIDAALPPAAVADLVVGAARSGAGW